VVRPLPQALRRALVAAALAALSAVLPAAGAATAAAAPGASAGAAGARDARPPAAWVRVSVATLWVRPGDTRRVDRPSAAYPADPRAWVAAMTTTQKRWLVGRLETQALYGAKVYVLRTSGSWSRVVAAGQPTPRHGLGYPGWLPTRQLTTTEPQVTDQLAVVRRRAVWLHETATLEERVLELSYGTRLPVRSVTGAAVEVARPEGGAGFVPRTAVALHTSGAAWPALTGARLVAEARRFRGLQYLWAGTSGSGVDCSGFTHLVCKALGVTIPRDAADQMAAGRPVRSRASLRAGDLVFFRGASGTVHHVGLCVGGGRMIHAPSTGRAVTEVSLGAEPYRSEFAGGRRLTPAGGG
jgi:cell wall-associated NlpC family hydrolase